MTIRRQAIILLLAAPVPAVLVKLQGTLLSSLMIVMLSVVASLYLMASEKLDTIKPKTLFVFGNILSTVGSGGSLLLWFLGVEPLVIIIWIPVVAGLGFAALAVMSDQLKNILKDKYKEDFNQSSYDQKKKKYQGGASLVGQGLAAGFYMSFSNIDPLMVLVIIEAAKTAAFLIFEYQRWQLLKEMDII